MALSTARVAGVRHVLNSTNVDPEGESQGIRGDWIAELYGSVTDYADLPSSGNWVGRRRWVTTLAAEFMWSGTQWILTGGRVPFAVGGLAANQTLSTGTNILAMTNTIDQSQTGLISSGGSFVAPIPGRYRISANIRVTTGGGNWFVQTRQATDSGEVQRAAGSAQAGRLSMVDIVRLAKDEWIRPSLTPNGALVAATAFATGTRATFEYISP